jgi:hypothetical protein
MQGECQLWIVVFNVAHVLLVSLFQISACLSHICVFTCFACYCIDSTVIVVLSFAAVLGFGELS